MFYDKIILEYFYDGKCLREGWERHPFFCDPRHFDKLNDRFSQKKDIVDSLTPSLDIEMLFQGKNWGARPNAI
jgi:hypothetical protein